MQTAKAINFSIRSDVKLHAAYISAQAWRAHSKNETRVLGNSHLFWVTLKRWYNNIFSRYAYIQTHQ